MKDNTLLNQDIDQKAPTSSIYQKIEQKGKLDAEEILRLGRQKAEALKASILDAAKEEYQEALAKAKEKKDDQIKAKITEFEQAAKQEILRQKQSLINQAFKNAHDRLLQLNDQELANLVVKLILSEKTVGNEVLKVSKGDYLRYSKLFSSGKVFQDGKLLLDKLNNLLKSPNYQFKLSNEPLTIEGGFYLEGKNFDIDFSFQAILDELQKTYETQIASILFQDGE